MSDETKIKEFARELTVDIALEAALTKLFHILSSRQEADEFTISSEELWDLYED